MENTMKTLSHIPTNQFEFLEVEHNPETLEQAVDFHNSLRDALKEPKMASGEGLSPQDWRLAYDGYMEAHTLTSEVYEKMNSYQQFAIQEEKKRYKRLKAKE